MSNLETFVKYRNRCPVCDSELGLCFIFKSKSTMKEIEGKIVCGVEIAGNQMSKKSFRYTAKFNIDPQTNDFHVDFYDKNGQLYDRLFLSVKERYDEFVRRHQDNLRFYKECLSCRKYNYSSKKIVIDHQSRKLSGFEVGQEYFCLGRLVGEPKEKSFQNDYQVFKLLNHYDRDTATIMTGKTSKFEYDRMGGLNVAESMLAGFVETNSAINLSNIDSMDKLMDKLNLFYRLA